MTLYSSQEDQASAADIFSKTISWYQNNDVSIGKLSLSCAVLCVLTLLLLSVHGMVPTELSFGLSLQPRCWYFTTFFRFFLCDLPVNFSKHANRNILLMCCMY